MAEDNWQHRSDGMKCKTCMWFVPKIPLMEPYKPGPMEQVERVEPKTYSIGRCRRHAPTMNGFPVVFVNDWCGDHKLNENKV